VHHRHHRQEHWLHTRISEGLREALEREARRRRLPVSLLVRNVLESALDLVEDVVGASLGTPRRTAARRDLADVYGWQELILNRAAACARCATALEPGTRAHRGLRDGPGRPVFLCGPCVRRLADDRKEEAP
jgi:hypothetical protein